MHVMAEMKPSTSTSRSIRSRQSPNNSSSSCGAPGLRRVGYNYNGQLTGESWRLLTPQKLDLPGTKPPRASVVRCGLFGELNSRSQKSWSETDFFLVEWIDSPKLVAWKTPCLVSETEDADLMACQVTFLRFWSLAILWTTCPVSAWNFGFYGRWPSRQADKLQSGMPWLPCQMFLELSTALINLDHEIVS